MDKKIIPVIVAGSRTFSFRFLLQEKLFKILNEENLNIDGIAIVSGGARGADECGEMFAEQWGCKIVRFPADWETYGKSAGFIRNKQMVDYAKKNNGILVAFWNEKSKGTKHTIDLAEQSGLKTYIVKYKEGVV